MFATNVVLLEVKILYLSCRKVNKLISIVNVQISNLLATLELRLMAAYTIV